MTDRRQWTGILAAALIACGGPSETTAPENVDVGRGLAGDRWARLEGVIEELLAEPA